MEQAVASTAQKMIEKPTEAWMAALPILFVGGAILILVGVYLLVRYVMTNNQALTDKIMSENSKREERLIGIIDGTLKDMTEALASVRTDVQDVKEEIAEMKRGEVN